MKKDTKKYLKLVISKEQYFFINDNTLTSAAPILWRYNLCETDLQNWYNAFES